jgi:ABC-type transport system involved in cytochrome bd biosynthesis fused ATPase/permease subunit
VALVCFIFLFHLRSALVAIISLPLGILAAFIVMHLQGSTPTSCRWAASPSPSARWWMRRW